MLVLLFAYSINFVQRYIFISNYYFKMQVFCTFAMFSITCGAVCAYNSQIGYTSILNIH